METLQYKVIFTCFIVKLLFLWSYGENIIGIITINKELAII